MHYFFKEGVALSAGMTVELDPDDRNHAWRVLRMRKNSEAAIADGRGAVYRGAMESIDSEAALVRLEGPLPAAESICPIVLLQGLLKGEKMDLIIRQAAELGVVRIIPVFTERSIPRFGPSRETGRQKRWRNIVRAASAQCRRALLPDVERVYDFEEALSLLKGRKAIVPWEGEKEMGMERALEQPPAERDAVFIFTGPEGGFGIQEIAAIAATGASIVHLGPRILRSETAAAITIALVQAAWGDLGVDKG